MAFNTPFKMWKRYEFNGGTSDPCIVSWPAGIKAGGEIRTQYHHAIDLVPTILDVARRRGPRDDQGPHAEPLRRREHALQLRRRRRAPTARATQFYSMLGSRGIWHDGWKAVTNHPTISGWSNFNDDEWELYHTEVDRSELHNLAAEHPEKLRELVNLWFAEAGANGAFPLDDRVRARDHPHAPAGAVTAARPLRLLPGHAPKCPSRRRSTSATARSRSARSSTSRPRAPRACSSPTAPAFGGHALYVKDNRLHYVYNFVGMVEQKIVATEDIPIGENLILSASFDKDGEDPPHVASGILSLWHGDRRSARARIKTQPGKFMLAGEGLCVGRDSGAGVTDDYPGEQPWPFTGGTINRVAVDVSGEPYVDLEREAAAMLMRE